RRKHKSVCSIGAGSVCAPNEPPIRFPRAPPPCRPVPGAGRSGHKHKVPAPPPPPPAPPVRCRGAGDHGPKPRVVGPVYAGADGVSSSTPPTRNLAHIYGQTTASVIRRLWL